MGSRSKRLTPRRSTPWTLWIVVALMLLVMAWSFVWEEKHGHRPPTVAQPGR
jgi:hypothetical protein